MGNDFGIDSVDMGRVPFLSNLLPAQVEALCRAARRVRVGAGHAAFAEGDEGQELFVILDGEVSIEKGAPPQVVATLGPGTVFGEMNFLVGDRRTATARALRDCRLLAFSRDGVDALDGVGRQAAAAMMETIARVLALRLAHLTREMTAMAREIVREGGGNDDLARRMDDRAGRAAHEWTESRATD